MTDAILTGLLATLDPASEAKVLYQTVSDLFPVCRSITGAGLRSTLHYLERFVPLTLHEVPTGTQVFDWTVPKEWNIRDAWIKNSRGERVVDFQKNNLHVLNYSAPVRATLSLAELRPHLFTLPDKPDWIPYRTSYYKETWGFCLTEHQLSLLPEDQYSVCIDSTLQPGHLTYGEFLKPGETENEILFSCHACHPSLCNDNLSGMAVTARLAQFLSSVKTRYSYRFVWIPGTIGAITWLAHNESRLNRIKGGLVVSCVGDRGKFTYKKSRSGDATIDRIVQHALAESGDPFRISDFSPLGYDERQYNSPGIHLPVGCFMRTPNGQYPEYHTSADNLQLVSPEALAGSLSQLLAIVRDLEGTPDMVAQRDTALGQDRFDPPSMHPTLDDRDQSITHRRYQNLQPKGEPQLGRRGLYRSTGGTSGPRAEESMLWVLNLSDGSHSLLDISKRSGLPCLELAAAAERLQAHELLRLID